MTDTPVCNYEGSRYSTEFWTSFRAYEDAVERIALRTLLPPRGRTLIEIGAGHGRLGDLYAGYDTVIFFDYARTQLEQAVARWGAGGNGQPRYLYVQGNFYHLPFVPGLFDTVTMVRTLHHAENAPAVLRGVAEILAPRGVFVLEFANKRNVKAIARYLLRLQAWSPFTQEPVEFAELNFDFHPHWIWDQLRQVELQREAVRTVSHFRAALLKKLIPTAWLVKLDALIQPTGLLWQYSPSVFVRARTGGDHAQAPEGAFFRCPTCGASLGQPTADGYRCSCGATWPREGQIYNFRR